MFLRITIFKKVLADGAYDSKDNFKDLDELKITPIIKVRKNSSIKNNINCMPRKLSVLQQFKDITRWKKKLGYEYRYMDGRISIFIHKENVWLTCILYKME